MPKPEYDDHILSKSNLMRRNIPTLIPESTYQIFNRGINSEVLFKEPRNFSFFLQKLAFYILPVADLYAYCLMMDHFHLCIHTHSEEQIRTNLRLEQADERRPCSWHISNRFASFFKSYAQGINKAFQRTGGLFEEPFRRKEVADDVDLRWLICYVHSNPKLHGLLSDFSQYPFSSYASFLSTEPTKLNRDFVLSAYGGADGFENFHLHDIPTEFLNRLSMD